MDSVESPLGIKAKLTGSSRTYWSLFKRMSFLIQNEDTVPSRAGDRSLIVHITVGKMVLVTARLLRIYENFFE